MEDLNPRPMEIQITVESMPDVTPKDQHFVGSIFGTFGGDAGKWAEAGVYAIRWAYRM
jgi:hypothetical protein